MWRHRPAASALGKLRHEDGVFKTVSEGGRKVERGEREGRDTYEVVGVFESHNFLGLLLCMWSLTKALA